MKNIWDKPWFIRIISLLLAVLLVIYIDSTQTGFWNQNNNNKTLQTANETQTIKVPLQISVDTDKYYVVGYPEKVKIRLTGANALVTSTVNTQNFRAYVDLTKKKVGKHTVKVRVSGLNKQLSYTINPQKITVDIQTRKSRTLPVQIGYNKNAVATGYHLGKPIANPDRVEVTGAIGEVDQIDQIIAKVILPSNINHNYERQAILIAQDRNGRQLNVVIQPSTVRVNIPITISKKTVKLKLSSKNEANGKVYSVTAKQDSVVLYGDKSVLNKITRANVDVNLKGVTSSTTKSFAVELPHGVIQANPKEVQIQIKVKESNSKQN